MNPSPDRERTYLYLTLVTLVIGGGLLIALIYGPWALMTALPFLLSGALFIIILWAVVGLAAAWRRKSEHEYHEAAARYIARKQRESLQREEEAVNDETDCPGC